MQFAAGSLPQPRDVDLYDLAVLDQPDCGDRDDAERDVVSPTCPRTPRCSHTKSSPASELSGVAVGDRYLPSPIVSTNGLPTTFRITDFSLTDR
jgi:hypothetical protein